MCRGRPSGAKGISRPTAWQCPDGVSPESQLAGRTLFLGVDTLDPTKGLVHKLLAFEELFQRHPELADELAAENGQLTVKGLLRWPKHKTDDDHKHHKTSAKPRKKWEFPDVSALGIEQAAAAHAPHVACASRAA